VAMQCAYHPGREPVGACVACGKLICVECKATLGGKYYCTPCADKIFVHKQAETDSKPEPAAYVAPVAPPQQPAQPKQTAQAQATTASAISVQEEKITTNESGQGSASVLPEELKGWNWGAFFLSWIWGIGNSVWIAFLCFIPVINIVMIFVLGAKGNEWAWQNKKWNSIEHFRKTQRTWKRWGVALFIIGLVIAVIYGIVALFLTLSGMGTISFGP
jgi:hypothetical protein